MTDSLLSIAVRERLEQLRAPNSAFNARHPGEVPHRQPVHTVYGGGQLFRADTAAHLGEVARQAMANFAPHADTLSEALGGLPHAASA